MSVIVGHMWKPPRFGNVVSPRACVVRTLMILQIGWERQKRADAWSHSAATAASVFLHQLHPPRLRKFGPAVTGDQLHPRCHQVAGRRDRPHFAAPNGLTRTAGAEPTS